MFKVDKVTPPAAIAAPEEDALKVRIEQLLGEDAISEYFAALEQRYGVSVNQQALAKLVGTNEEQ